MYDPDEEYEYEEEEEDDDCDPEEIGGDSDFEPEMFPNYPGIWTS